MTDGMSRGAWRMILLASLGGTLDRLRLVSGIFAAQIGRAVFPSQDPLVSLMVTFTTFAIGYLARPLGGLVLGRSLGDKFGRRGVFLASIFITSAATLGIGIVPTYAVWGITASVIVVLLRLTQGFCLGGELPGAITYVVESAPRMAPFVCSVVFGFVTLGVALGTTIALVVGRRYCLPRMLRYTAGVLRLSSAACSVWQASGCGDRSRSRRSSQS